jgi:hypothetical protein
MALRPNSCFLFAFLLSVSTICGAQNTNKEFSYKHLNEIASQKHPDYERLSVMTSFWGNYSMAFKFMDLAFDKKFPHYSRLITAGYIPLPLADALDKISKNQVVFINEAHHLPGTRMATILMLKKMYEKGFRYLACEGLAQDSTLNLNRRAEYTDFSYPEVLYGEMIRQALSLGYTIVAYDGSCKGYADSTADVDQNCREKLQAQTLYDKVLKEHPNAKMIVHAGYSHINKHGGSGWNPMGKYFVDITGITPYGINQISMTAEDSASLENFYRSNHLPKDTPVFLAKGDSMLTLWGKDNPYYDAELFLSRELLVNKSHLMKCLPKRKAVDVSKLCSNFKQPFVIEALLKSEGEKAVAFDALEINGANKPVLYLENGTYVFKIISTQGLILSTKEYTLGD